MTDYVFDQMTASDAAGFDFPDTLTFARSSVWTLSVIDTPATTTDPETFTITEANQTLTFLAHPLIDASAATFVKFANGDGLELGGSGDDNLSLPDIGPGHANLIESFGGNDLVDMTGWGGSRADDIVNAGDGNDTIIGSSSYTDSQGNYVETDILQGGAGDDVVTGGDGNDHLYGNVQTDAAGTSDGNDTLSGGVGNDYVQGNAGNDLIDGGDGNDRLYGGADNDSITGGAGNDYLQGNKGDDTLFSGDGDDQIRGGAGNDAIDGGNGDDNLAGDDGDDVIRGGSGIDTLTGGAGNDVFLFTGPGEASSAHIGATGPDAGQVETITDFGSGDHISLFFGIPVVFHAAAGMDFQSAAAAQTYAEQIMLDATQGPHMPGDNAQEIAAIQVGHDTYLFYNDVYGQVSGTDSVLGVNSAIKLVGVHADDITASSFGF